MIQIEKQFHAPIAKVWDAITNKDTMKKWYFDIDDFELKVRPFISIFGQVLQRVKNGIINALSSELILRRN